MKRPIGIAQVCTVMLPLCAQCATSDKIFLRSSQDSCRWQTVMDETTVRWRWPDGATKAAETPAVFWASSPTRPGEHVLLGGGGWDEGEVLAVEIGGRRVKPNMVSRTGLVFGWPADLAQSVAEARVIGASGTSKPVIRSRTAWEMGKGWTEV